MLGIRWTPARFLGSEDLFAEKLRDHEHRLGGES